MSLEPRLGFCCKFVPESGDPDETRAMNLVRTTMAHLSRLGPRAAFDKLAVVVRHNLEALRRQVTYVASLPPIERLYRISSDVLPGYTHPVAGPFYQDSDIRNLIAGKLADTGAFARERNVRLSMHPSQFCVIASASADAAANGIAEFEYHAEVMTLLGFGSGWHPHGAHVNIHGGARAMGAERIRAGLAGLSQTARNLITLENDEVSYGLDDLLPLSDDVPIVLDLHHHWIASRGEYIQPDDPRIRRIVESWRGVRPLSHVSVSREEILAGHDAAVLPDFDALLSAGWKPKDLRAHSDLMWNGAVSDLVIRHMEWSDFEVEAKLKNLASRGLARHAERRLRPQERAGA
jgi:UV DNA damage repair endonuclease